MTRLDRRSFLRAALAGAAGLALPAAGCGGLPGAAGAARPPEGPDDIDGLLARGARVLWVAAHPDDECFAGPILARAGRYHRRPLWFLVLTSGDGGECNIPGGCRPDLATVRRAEMRAVAARYGARLQHERFWNAPLPVASFPPRPRIGAVWRARRDPVALVAATVRGFRPDVLLTFDPDFGATGHPEHQLASRVATAAVRLAADGAAAVPGPPHRVGRTYYVLNRFWPLRLVGRADPGPVTERFDATLPCTPTQSCLRFMLEATRLHRSQDRDMENVRSLRSAFATLDLRQADPFTHIKDPYGA
jgi:LmbE family N-acetylglucosaminyl deacetylase